MLSDKHGYMCIHFHSGLVQWISLQAVNDDEYTSEAQVNLCPSPGMNIKDPCVVQYFVVSTPSSS